MKDHDSEWPEGYLNAGYLISIADAVYHGSPDDRACSVDENFTSRRPPAGLPEE